MITISNQLMQPFHPELWLMTESNVDESCRYFNKLLAEDKQVEFILISIGFLMPEY